MSLPFEPPIKPMLAKLQTDMPEGEEWLYEPKWDGFRAIVFRDGAATSLISRDERPFERYFPELIPALEAALPGTCVVDGEIVIAQETSLDFDALLLRIHPAASRVQMLAEASPSSFVAFDILAEGDKDLRGSPLTERRAALEERLGHAVIPAGTTRDEVMSLLRPAPRVALTPQTDEVDEARRWFEAYEGAGLDGVIAKKRDLLYLPGQRAMLKLKHKRTADCVVGGYRLSKTGDGIGSLLLGLYDDDGGLHYVGHTSSFKAAERRSLLAELKPLEGPSAFGAGRTPGGPSRWASAKDVSWVSLEPSLVCEVSFDHMQGHRFRHAATFMRWRPEKKPLECKLDQVLS